jgi:hypothetical protein
MRILHFSMSLGDYDLQKNLKILPFKLFIGSYGVLNSMASPQHDKGKLS